MLYAMNLVWKYEHMNGIQDTLTAVKLLNDNRVRVTMENAWGCDWNSENFHTIHIFMIGI